MAFKKGVLVAWVSLYETVPFREASRADKSGRGYWLAEETKRGVWTWEPRTPTVTELWEMVREMANVKGLTLVGHLRPMKKVIVGHSPDVGGTCLEEAIVKAYTHFYEVQEALRKQAYETKKATKLSKILKLSLNKEVV